VKIARRFNAGTPYPFRTRVPVGTADISRPGSQFSRASGTLHLLHGPIPASKLAGYFRWSLRDRST